MANEHLYLCDVSRNKICDLIDSTPYKARNILESYKTNEITTLSFDIPVVPNGKWRNIQNEQLVFYNDEYYIIKTPTFYHDEDGKLYLKVECKHLSDILANSIISTEEVIPMNIIDLMKMALLYDENGVSQTGWTVGTVNVDKVMKRGLEAVEQSSYSILLSIAEKFDAIMVFDSVNMKVNVLPVSSTERPEVDLRVSKNLKSVQISYDTSEMYTRLYCYGGQDEDGNELDIMSVNPTGMAYIDNFEYFKRIGYTDEFIQAHKQYFVRTNLWRDSAYYDAQDLYDDGVKQLAKIAVPIVTIKVTALDTTKFGVSNALTNLQVGDCIRVYDEDIGLDTLCNVTSRDINHEEPHLLNIEVTNSIVYHDTLSQLFTNVNTMSVVGTGTGSGGGTSDDWHGNVSVDDIYDLHLYYLTAEQIEAKYASIEYLTANYLTANEIRANYIDAVSIAAQYATIGSLEALEAKIGELNVDYINGKFAEFDKLLADNAEFHKLIATDAEIEDLKAGTLTVTGLLKASNAEIDNIKATYVQVGDFNAYKATIENLFALYATIEHLEANYITAQQIEAVYAKITDLDVVNATITNLKAQVINVEQLVAEKASIEDLNAVNASIETINAKLITVDEVLAKVITTDELNAEIAKVEQLIADNISAVNASIEALDAKFATIEQLNAEIATVKTLIADKATIEDLNAAIADIGELNAGLANIESILSGNIGTGLLQTIHLTAKNVVIDDAIIKSAMIESIDVGKLTAGVISTNKFQVQSDDGGFKVVGNTTQWTDATGKVRMQAGRDAEGNFNFAVFGEDGTTAIYTENGVQKGGIADQVIVDDMVADNAGIQASKIQYVDVDGDKTLQTIIDIQQGSIDALIRDTTITPVELPTISDGILIFDDEMGAYLTDTSIVDFSSGIYPDILEKSILGFQTNTTKLKDKFLDLSATVDGINVTVGKVETNIDDVNSKVASLELTTDGLTTKVTQTSEDVNNAITIATQAADKFSWLVKSGTDETNFTLTDRTAELVSEQINLKGLVTFSGLDSSTQERIDAPSDIISDWTSDAILRDTIINGGYIKTSSITADKLNVEEILADNGVFLGILEAREINADRITSGEIRSDLLNVYGLNVHQKDTDIITLNIDSNGSVTVRGSVESYDYVKGVSGWSIKATGDAEFNDVTVRGDLIGNYGGIMSFWGNDVGSDIKDVVIWAGASYDQREFAPFIVYSDGSVKAEIGEYSGIWTGAVQIGNITISDPNRDSGSDALVVIQDGNNGIKRVSLSDTTQSTFAQNLVITDNFYNQMIELRQDGLVKTTGSFMVSENDFSTSIEKDGININGACIFGGNGALTFTGNSFNVGSPSSSSLLEVFGDVVVSNTFSIGNELVLGGNISCRTTPNGLDFAFNDMCSVTFNSYGGSQVQTQFIRKGGYVIKPADPVRNQYIFDGWYKDSELTTVWNFSADVVTGNITLYAKWLALPNTPIVSVENYTTQTYHDSSGDTHSGVEAKTPLVVNANTTDGGTLTYSWEVYVLGYDIEWNPTKERVFQGKTNNTITVDELNQYIRTPFDSALDQKSIHGTCKVTNTLNGYIKEVTVEVGYMI